MTVVALSPFSPESSTHDRAPRRRHVSGPNTPAPVVGPGLTGACTAVPAAFITIIMIDS